MAFTGQENQVKLSPIGVGEFFENHRDQLQVSVQLPKACHLKRRNLPVALLHRAGREWLVVRVSSAVERGQVNRLHFHRWARAELFLQGGCGVWPIRRGRCRALQP